MKVTIDRAPHFRGVVRVPGDKSISHRALIFGALAEGTTEIEGLVDNADVNATRACLEKLGTEIKKEGARVFVVGKPLVQPTTELNCGNSGTSMRTLLGVLAGFRLRATLVGDESLSNRPMTRVMSPLESMGAKLCANNGKAPVTIQGSDKLRGIDYSLDVASAQVKTAILLAGLRAATPTRLTGKIGSRDHTEKMLAHFGVVLDVTKDTLVLQPGQRLKAASVKVPGDPSSAAFFAAGAALIKDGNVTLENVLLNPTRTGFFRVLERMGARVTETVASTSPESVGKIEVAHVSLKGTSVTAEEVPSLIDEIPLIAVLASQAVGITEVRGAEELRVKESDRLSAIAENLRAMGVRIDMFDDGFRISGPQPLKGAKIEPRGDHRIAMAFAVAGLVAEGLTEIKNAECASVSFRNFYVELEACRA